MLKLTRACVVLSLVVLAAGCNRQDELVMVDQRTGVKVICVLDESNAAKTNIGNVRQAYTCIDELQYYGFRDEQLINPQN